MSAAASRRWVTRVIASSIGSLGLPLCAQAAPLELVLKLDISSGYESNPFQQPEEAAPASGAASSAAATPRATRRHAQTAEGAVVVPLASDDSRLALSGRIGRQRFDPISELDHQQTEVDGRLQWRFGPLLQAALRQTASRLPYAFQDGSYLKLDMTERHSRSAELTLQPTPALSLPLSVQQQSLRHDDRATHGVLDRKEQQASLALRWRSPTRSELQLGYMMVEADFPRRTPEQIAALDSGWTERQVFASADWQYSVKTRLSGRIAQVRREHPARTERNTQLVSRTLRLTHQPSPMSRLELELWRQPKDTEDPSTLTSLSRGFRLSAAWQPSDFARMALAYGDERQRYDPALGSAATGATLGRTRSLGWRLQYQLSRDLSAQMELGRERQSRSTFSSDITQSVLRLSLSYSFENLAGGLQRSGLGAWP